jgi:hypothetical protein
MSGMLGGLFAGVGLSIIFNSHVKEIMADKPRRQSASQGVEPAKGTTEKIPPTTSHRRSVPSPRKGSRAAGKSLAAFNIQTKEQKTSEEQTANDSLGG